MISFWSSIKVDIVCVRDVVKTYGVPTEFSSLYMLTMEISNAADVSKKDFITSSSTLFTEKEARKKNRTFSGFTELTAYTNEFKCM